MIFNIFYILKFEILLLQVKITKLLITYHLHLYFLAENFKILGFSLLKNRKKNTAENKCCQKAKTLNTLHTLIPDQPVAVLKFKTTQIKRNGINFSNKTSHKSS